MSERSEPVVFKHSNKEADCAKYQHLFRGNVSDHHMGVCIKLLFQFKYNF